jgi:hypothetical protein
MPHQVKTRTKTLTRGSVAAAAAVILASSAAVADDVLTPEQRALLDPANYETVLRYDQQWTANSLRNGEYPGTPGNSHRVHLAVRQRTMDQAAGVPTVTIDLTDDQCDGAACRTLRTAKGTITGPEGLDLTPGSSARVRLTITDGTPGVAITRAPGVPADPLVIDVTIAPRTPFDTNVTLDEAVLAFRRQSVTEGSYQARGASRSAPAVLSGTVSGISLGAADYGQVSFEAIRAATLRRLAPVRTAPARRPWLPATSGGRVTGPGGVDAHRSGYLSKAPVTSTGRRPAGNRHNLLMYLQVDQERTSFFGYLDSRNCEPGQAWADCDELPDYVRLSPRAVPTVVVGRDGVVTATGVFSVAPGSVADQDPEAWGTVRISAAWAPGRIGAPREELSYYTIGETVVTQRRELGYGTGELDLSPPRSRMSIGGAVVKPPTDPTRESDHLAYSTR